MKITYYDLFNLIAEDAGIMLAQSENSMIRPDLCDINETVHSVMEQAARSGSHTAKKRERTGTERCSACSSPPSSSSLLPASHSQPISMIFPERELH